MNLILFTSTYPYDGGAEQTFLELEIQHLRNAFSRVILVPKKIDGNRLAIPDGVEVDTSYADYLKNAGWFSLMRRVFGSIWFYRELFSRPSLLFYPQALIRMTRFLAVAQLTFDWVLGWLSKMQNPAEKNVFYTYWFDSSSFGIGLAKRHCPNLHLVSRTHGYDLYEEDHKPPYWPFRKDALSMMEALYPDSDAGRNYLMEKYPAHAAIIQTDRLGVPSSGFLNQPSVDGVFRIVSCSMIVPVKRVELLLDGLLHAARQRPDQRFEWVHMGNGDSREELQKYADENLPPNAKARFPGYSTKAELMEYYMNTPLDVFVNVSISEGTPVSIMEAISCSIPVIATNVGGNPEIVSERNGILLNANPSPEEIACAILKIVDNSAIAQKMRLESRKVWEESYNAETNFQKFAERLEEIAKG